MKVWNYVFAFVMLSVLLDLLGISTSNGVLTTIGYARNTTGITFNFSTSAFFTSWAIIGTLAGAVGGWVASLFTRAQPENYIIFGLVTGGTLGLFSGIIDSLVSSLSASSLWIQGVAIIIIAPITVGYFMALAEFLRGTD